jgi:ATP-dependent 26S proteasome regulatory subunit
MKSEMDNIRHNAATQKKLIDENKEKIRMQKSLPYLVGNVVEILDGNPDDVEEGNISRPSLALHCLVVASPALSWLVLPRLVSVLHCLVM